jgi:LacI family transcriptional regulator
MLSDPPSAFLVASIIWGLGDRRAIDEARLVLGRDISVVFHDDALSSLQNGSDVPVFIPHALRSAKPADVWPKC